MTVRTVLFGIGDVLIDRQRHLAWANEPGADDLRAQLEKRGLL
ncbi:hypothetical protein QTO30_11360 [Yoonia sp. GPGPB17]